MYNINIITNLMEKWQNVKMASNGQIIAPVHQTNRIFK